ncbi:MAG: saccharopine dehydrogenase NADP-binding domain-containing protein [Dethiobacter sp.]|jgi:saccharopine dehydrogenase-like NADP-dependent oxidoreductase|nr:saccharopine dehydrogenase NADP-binding domain-containing protein [Dethiobacter sp.]
MRIVVFGGAGDMGSRAVEDLAAQDDVSLVTIADRDMVRADRIASKIGAEKVSTSLVDATKPDTLLAAMSQHHVAASALGPFYRFEKTLAQAAIKAGINYVSICDDYDALASVKVLDSEAKEKGVAIISGIGWTPGISNLLAVRGAEQLDTVSAIKIYWAGSSADSAGMAVILHTLHIFTGYVPTYKECKTMMVRAGTEKERIRFPAPLNDVNTYHLGHPEPLTLPERYPAVSTVSLKGGLVEGQLNTLAILMDRLRLTRSNRQKQALASILKKTLPVLDRLFKGKACSGIKVIVEGEKDGSPHSVSGEAAAPMRELTGVPLSITALLLGRGQIKAAGVLAPESEGCIDHRHFFSELEKRNVKITQTF